MGMNLDEPVMVDEYDPTWPRRFGVERQRIVSALADIEVDIEHIGSTAVPGLDAKPVIDILVGHVPPTSARQVAVVVTELGYEPLGEAGVPGRLYFRYRSPSQSFNMHVVERGGQLWSDNLALRDYLRRHPTEVQAYGGVKRRAAERASDSLIRYSRLKAQAVETLLDRARAEATPGSDESDKRTSPHPERGT